jgi:hypothetical protein
MSEPFPFMAWLDAAQLKHVPDYYALLDLNEFESDQDRIEHAIFQMSMSLSTHLRGECRASAEAALEELNRAEACLTDAAAKKAYDDRLRATGSGVLQETIKLRSAASQPTAARSDCSVALLEQVTPDRKASRMQLTAAESRQLACLEDDTDEFDDAVPAARAVPTSHATPTETTAPRRPTAPGGGVADASAASSADDVLWKAIQQSQQRGAKKPDPKPRQEAAVGASSPAAASPANVPLTETNTSVEPTEPPQPASAQNAPLSLSAALLQTALGPLAKYSKPLAAGLLAAVSLVAVGVVIQRVNDRPATPRQRIVLSQEESNLATQQISVLYDLGQETAIRAAAAEKLRDLSPQAVKKFSYRLNDLAGKQPEESIQQTLLAILDSAAVPH